MVHTELIPYNEELFHCIYIYMAIIFDHRNQGLTIVIKIHNSELRGQEAAAITQPLS